MPGHCQIWGAGWWQRGWCSRSVGWRSTCLWTTKLILLDSLLLTIDYWLRSLGTGVGHCAMVQWLCRRRNLFSVLLEMTYFFFPYNNSRSLIDCFLSFVKNTCRFNFPVLKGLLQMWKMGLYRGFLGGWVRKCYWFLKIRAHNGEFDHLSSNETNNYEELAYQRSRGGIFSENAL